MAVVRLCLFYVFALAFGRPDRSERIGGQISELDKLDSLVTLLLLRGPALAAPLRTQYVQGNAVRTPSTKQAMPDMDELLSGLAKSAEGADEDMDDLFAAPAEELDESAESRREVKTWVVKGAGKAEESKLRFDSLRVKVTKKDGSDEMLGILATDQAVQEAAERELDVIVINAQAEPPVAILSTIGKWRFGEKRKAKEGPQKRTRSPKTKELKLRYNTGEHDFQVIKKKAEKFLVSGDSVKFTMQFKGRIVEAHVEEGKAVLTRLSDDLEKCGSMDRNFRMQGRMMNALMKPSKAR
jgi:translation initiation factor IF-3